MRGHKNDETPGIVHPDLPGKLYSVYITFQINIEKIDTGIRVFFDGFQQFIRVGGIKDELHIQLFYQYGILNHFYDRFSLCGIIFTDKDVKHVISLPSYANFHILCKETALFRCLQQYIIVSVDQFLRV